jgi:hypothetical protein
MSTRFRTSTLVVVASVTLGMAGVTRQVRAQSTPAAPSSSPPSTVAEAERLFKAGVERLDAGDLAAACPLLEQSQSLDPSSGTLLNLGECYERAGRAASAWYAFGEASRLARATGRADRVQVAELRRERLGARLRRLTIVPPAEPIAGLTIYLDDRSLPPAAWRTPLPVDPGVHVIRASAPARRDVVLQAEAPDAGSTRDVAILALPPASAESNESGSPAERAAVARWQPPAAIACAVLGGVGVVTGAVFGLRSRSKHEASDEYCDGDVCRDPAGIELMESARTAGNISTAAFIVGGVGVGAAAVLWFVPFGTEGQPATAELGVGPGTVELRGVW